MVQAGARASRPLPAAVLLLGLLGTPAAQGELVFSAPPRESEAKAVEVYQPIADFMAKVLGEPVTFRYADNWLTYQSEMRKGEYDLVFDGPHFIGWRMAKLGHVPLVKLPGNLAFVTIVREDNPKVKELKDLAGRSLCGFAPPNLATLTVLVQFENPARQPALVESRSFADSYKDVVAGKCVGAVLQVTLWQNFEKEKPQTRAVFRSKPVANQAFSAGPKISPENRARLAEALLSPDGKAATNKLREKFKRQDFVPATVGDYDGLGVLLKDVWGFDL